MRTILIAAALLAAVSLAPAARAGPDCLQVYPWSELCDGDVRGFVDAVLGETCIGTLVCVDPHVCIKGPGCVYDPVCPGGPPCPPDPTSRRAILA